MRRVALHGLDQIGDEIVALLQQHVNIGEGFAAMLSHVNKTIVGEQHPDREDNDCRDNNPRKHNTISSGGALVMRAVLDAAIAAVVLRD